MSRKRGLLSSILDLGLIWNHRLSHQDLKYLMGNACKGVIIIELSQICSVSKEIFFNFGEFPRFGFNEGYIHNDLKGNNVHLLIYWPYSEIMLNSYHIK
jgi:hypothetical protein